MSNEAILEKVRSEVLTRRENVWNQLNAERNMLDRQELMGRLDAYQNVAEYIDELLEAENIKP